MPDGLPPRTARITLWPERGSRFGAVLPMNMPVWNRSGNRALVEREAERRRVRTGA
jgi:hypothetical protein